MNDERSKIIQILIRIHNIHTYYNQIFIEYIIRQILILKYGSHFVSRHHQYTFSNGNETNMEGEGY